jgi:hypothetical protein
MQMNCPDSLKGIKLPLSNMSADDSACRTNIVFFLKTKGMIYEQSPEERRKPDGERLCETKQGAANRLTF